MQKSQAAHSWQVSTVFSIIQIFMTIAVIKMKSFISFIINYPLTSLPEGL